MAAEKSEMECPLCLMMKVFKDHPVGQHIRASQRELLLAVRSILDTRIDALKDEKASGAKKVKVE